MIEDSNAQDSLDKFEPMKESIIATETAKDKQQKHKALDMDLQEEDWKAFLAGAKQRTFAKGEYVLQEGKPTAALFQIVKGTLRVAPPVDTGAGPRGRRRATAAPGPPGGARLARAAPRRASAARTPEKRRGRRRERELRPRPRAVGPPEASDARSDGTLTRRPPPFGPARSVGAAR